MPPILLVSAAEQEEADWQRGGQAGGGDWAAPAPPRGGRVGRSEGGRDPDGAAEDLEGSRVTAEPRGAAADDAPGGPPDGGTAAKTWPRFMRHEV